MKIDYKKVLIAHKSRPIEIVFEYAMELGYPYFMIGTQLYSVECTAIWKEVGKPNRFLKNTPKSQNVSK